MNKKWKKIEDIDLEGKKVFVRVDYNVPLDDEKIVDPTRIERSLPTLDLLIGKGAKLILASHLGRPKGEKNPALTLKPVAEYLTRYANEEVPLISDYIEDSGAGIKAALEKHRLVILENLRYYPGEKKGDIEFAKTLASFADIYVNDAFGTCHRAHASMSGIPKYIPGYPGLLLRNEIENFSRLLNIKDEDRPFICLLGGAKVANKIPIINHLLECADVIMIGGGMAFTFLKAQGMNVGASLVNDYSLDECNYIIDKAMRLGIDLVLPMDVVIAPGVSSSEGMNVEVDNIPSGMMGLDIGEQTQDVYINILQNSRSIFWNGPMGVFEEEPFKDGTVKLAMAIAESDSFTVIGGGDSVVVINELGLADKFDHISTGGGASLELISGMNLPGLAALS